MTLGPRVALASMLLLVVSCVATPMPEPPNLEPPDINLVIGTDIMAREPRLRLDGAAGAAEPGATIWVVGFGWWSPPSTTVVADDGSFSVVVTGYEGAAARIQTRTSELRSTPLDVILHEDANPESIVWESCLGLAPALELDLGEAAVDGSMEGVVEIHNGCSSDIEITIPPLYLGGFNFSVNTESPVNVPTLGEAQIEVAFEPESEGSQEDILLLEVVGPFEENRPITLFGLANP